MNQPAVIAMDLSSNGSDQYVVQEGPNDSLLKGSVQPTRDQLEELLQNVRNKSRSQKIVVVLEATGMSWFPVSVFFNRNQIDVYRVKAQQSKAFRKFLDRYAKTDEIDAEALAKMYYLIPDQLYKLWVPEGDQHSLKRWIKRREDLVENRSQELNRLQELGKWLLPGIRGSIGAYMGKKTRKILVHAMDYRWCCSHMGKDRFIRWARRHNAEISEEDLKQLFDAASEARKLYDQRAHDPEELRAEAQDILDHIQYLNDRIERIEERMKEAYKNTLSDRPVESVYGFGWLSAAVMKAYLGDGSRFPNIESAEAWVGYIPEIIESGETSKKGTDIRKDGPPIVRKFLFMATNTARQWDPQIAETYHDQMVNRGKTHTQAICKCANKVLRRVLRVLKDGKEYQLRDTEGKPINWKEAKRIIKEQYTVPEQIRKQRRNKVV